jgi:hypothetical protein
MLRRQILPSFGVFYLFACLQSTKAINLGPANVPLDGIMINFGLHQTSPTQLVEMLNYVCRNHRVRGGPKQYIGDLVLQDIADVDKSVSK